VVRLPENILFLSGYWPLNGVSYLLFPASGRPHCIIPSVESREAEAELWDADISTYPSGVLDAGDPCEAITAVLKNSLWGKKWNRIGFEGGFESMAPPWNSAEPPVPAAESRALLEEVFAGLELVDATALLYAQRAVKTAYEIDRLRRANEIAVFGLETFHRNVRPGVRGIDLVAEVEYAVMVEGSGYKDAGRVRAYAQVATGAAETAVGYRPMEITTTRKLESGELALLELAVVADGFWSDRTRVRVAGEPSPQQKAIFDLVVGAQEAAISAVKPAVSVGEVDEAARLIIREAGYGAAFVHVTGHGIGFRYHEPVPLVSPGGETMLSAGMIHTVEPGIYFPDFGGIRVEDDIVVTESGYEVLGPCRKELVS
jgi:Xaa-Pro dipeptidase